MWHGSSQSHFKSACPHQSCCQTPPSWKHGVCSWNSCVQVRLFGLLVVLIVKIIACSWWELFTCCVLGSLFLAEWLCAASAPLTLNTSKGLNRMKFLQQFLKCWLLGLTCSSLEVHLCIFVDWNQVTLRSMPFFPTLSKKAVTSPFIKYYMVDIRNDFRLGCFHFLCIWTFVFPLGCYPEDTAHKLHGISEQGISFVKSCVLRQNFNFCLKSHLWLRKTGANCNVLEMVSITVHSLLYRK